MDAKLQLHRAAGAPPPPRVDASAMAQLAQPLDAGLLMDVIDMLGHGIFVVDTEGRVLHANRSALHECGEGGALRLADARLSATDAPGDVELQRVLAGGRLHRFGLALVATRGRALAVAVVPLNGVRRGSGMPALLVLLGRHEASDDLSIELYAQANGLTGAESRVLRALWGGECAHDVARAFGVAISTIRTQIGSIREKTGARSLDDLNRLVGRLPPLAATALGARF